MIIVVEQIISVSIVRMLSTHLQLTPHQCTLSNMSCNRVAYAQILLFHFALACVTRNSERATATATLRRVMFICIHFSHPASRHRAREDVCDDGCCLAKPYVLTHSRIYVQVINWPSACACVLICNERVISTMHTHTHTHTS